MEFNQVNEQEFVDLFELKDVSSPTFNITSEEDDNDILGLNNLTTTTEAPVEESTEEVDILNTETAEEIAQKAGRKPKYDFSDIGGYFEDRFKNNKLIRIVGEDDKPIELKSPEDFDLVIEENIRYQVEQQKKELEKSWYQTKSPAFQAVAQYAELVQDPSEILPFLQGMNNMRSISEVDETSIEGAEQIVRYQKKLAGLPDDVVEEEIEALKSTDKLISSASKIKPNLLQREQANLVKMQESARQKEMEYWNTVAEYERKAKEIINTPLFGKVKLAMEDKEAVYDLIAIPSEESGGYKIYDEIDSLYEKADFETLREVALLLKKKEKYNKYVSQLELEKNNKELQKKLRLATETGKGSVSEDDTPTEPVIKARFKPFNSRG